MRYYGLRYYQPSTGHFISRDPISEQGGLNLYAFCGNNGVNRGDYLGMDDLYNEYGYYYSSDNGDGTYTNVKYLDSSWTEVSDSRGLGAIGAYRDPATGRIFYAQERYGDNAIEGNDPGGASSSYLDQDAYAAVDAFNSELAQMAAYGDAIDAERQANARAVVNAVHAATSRRPRTGGVSAPNKTGRKYGGFDEAIETGGRRVVGEERVKLGESQPTLFSKRWFWWSANKLPAVMVSPKDYDSMTLLQHEVGTAEYTWTVKATYGVSERVEISKSFLFFHWTREERGSRLRTEGPEEFRYSYKDHTLAVLPLPPEGFAWSRGNLNNLPVPDWTGSPPTLYENPRRGYYDPRLETNRVIRESNN